MISSRGQDVVCGVTGQSLFLDVPEGQPSSVDDVSVWEWWESDDSAVEGATTGSAAIDSVLTTMDAASGPAQTANANRVNVVATTGIVTGRSYLLTNTSTGAREWIEVAGVVTDQYVNARAPLYQDYPVGSQLAGTRVTISVDDTWVADSNQISDRRDPNHGYRVRWRYTVAGVSYTRLSYFDLVRYSGNHGVTAGDVEALLPGWIRMLPTDHQTDRGQRLLDEAYDQVTLDLHQERIPDQQVRNQQVIDELVKRKVVVLWQEARLMAGGDPTPLTVAQANYDRRFDSLVRAPGVVKVPVGTDASGAGNRVTQLGLTRR